MATFILLLMAGLCLVDITQVNGAKHDNDQDDIDNGELLRRVVLLEEKAARHPAELEALREEFKAEIANLVQVHNAEVTSLKKMIVTDRVNTKKQNRKLTREKQRLARENEILLRENQNLLQNVNLLQKRPWSAKSNPAIKDTRPQYEIKSTIGGQKGIHVETNTENHIPGHDGQEGQTNKIRRQQVNVEAGVAFFATLNNHAMHLGTNQNVIFENVVTNVGNAYDPHQGVFKAPVSGTYVFSVTMTVYGTDRTHFSFYKNSQRMTVIWLNGAENTGDKSSNTIVLNLNQGEDVSVRHTDTDKSANGHDHSMFSGFLLLSSGQTPSIVG